MAHRFIVPDSSPQGSPAPSTPEKSSGRSQGFSFMGNNPTTTPAGPPPSSVASFTPAGAPSESYLGSSIMRGVTGQRSSHAGPGASRGSSGTRLFGDSGKSNAPLGRSIAPTSQRQPSGLSRQYSLGNFEHDEDEEDEDEDAEGEDELPEENLFRSSFAPGKFQNNDLDREIEQAINQEMELEGDDEADSYEEEEEEEDEDDDEDEDGYDGQGDEEQSDEEAGEGSEDADMFLNMRHDDRPYGRSVIGEEESDLMMLNTPAATKKVRKEAEAIFKRSSNNLRRSTGRGVFEYGTIAKLLYSQQDIARVNEPGKLILATEDLVSEMYTEGVDTADNEERMEKSLANVTHGLLTIWQDHEASLPQPEGEAFAGIGPDHNADPFDKALWIAQLILRMHHTKFVDGGLLDNKTLPLPQILLEWIDKAHNLYPDQTRLVASHRPSPASHSLFWQTLRSLVLRGETSQATDLLRKAGWEHVRRGPRAEFAYTGKALEHVQQFTNAACDMLDNCPASKSDWDIWNSNWTLFRIQARGFRDKMTLFAEGTDDDFRNSIGEFTNPRGMSNMARKASSQLPWDIYENLQALYGIILGNREAIMDTAQDWLEATVGMLAWWDDGAQHMRKPLRIGGPSDLYQSSLQASTLGSSEDYFERLAAALHIVTKSDLEPNSQNPVEIALASVLEGNVNAVLAILRTWSLPIASSVAEIASLGQWLPPHEVARPFPLDTLDMDDLALLNISQPTPDDVQGIKDSTLEAYSRQLAGIEQLSPERDGWEMAIQVLGRMDVPEKSEEIVGELLRDILTTLDEHSSATVDKMWRILNDLGMINFAEETAETFADILSRESHRYGEALWYYALSHRTDRVREVLNLLTSYSLIQSTVYPPEKELDEELRNLLHNRTGTLERRAKQDLEAAQLLGRMLSGYATLRKFYELRDEHAVETMSALKAASVKKQAALALIAVISSSDDNIRGGLYDESRDAVVSEDFLLALLGEATVFVNQSPSLVSLDQIDILLKAIEDVQTVGSRVYSACDEFFNLVVSSGQGLKGSTPADLMKSTTSLSGSSYFMSGSSMLTSQLQKSMTASGKVRRGWDWRKGITANTKAEEVLQRLRLGLAKDLASLWLEDADGVVVY